MQIELLVRPSVGSAIKRRFPKSALTKTLKKLLSALECEERPLSVLLTDDKEIAVLNRQYRKKNRPTDVLSFPAGDFTSPDGTAPLGDLVISIETAARQAREFGVTFQEEMIRLLIHGLLHLLGYDHEKVPRKEAERMRRKERDLLGMFLKSRA
jgi:probable rRNA maturation factor